MSNLLIALIVVYIATIIIQIAYFVTWHYNDPFSCNPLDITIMIISIIFAPIAVLLEIGAALLFARLNN